MSVSIITFANLGKKYNLKTGDIEPVIDYFYTKKELLQVICQINKDFHFANTSSAIPFLIRGTIRFFEKISNSNLSRTRMEALFDFFASIKLEKADTYIFHAGYFLPKTFKVAKSKNGIIIDIAVGADLKMNKDLELSELAFLGLTKYQGINAKLDAIGVSSTNFDYLITMSEFAKRSYVQNGFPIEKIFVASPDINIKRFDTKQLLERDKKFRILYVAYTTPLKGLHYLFDAWKNFEADDASLTIVGGFSDMPESLKNQYMKMIKKDSRITWVPGTQEPEKYYCDASVLVFPSLTEGFGRVTLEAMACGIPVITTENARGIVEDGKTGFIVPIRSAKAILEKIEFLYHNPEIREQMGRDARKAVEQKKPFGEAVYEIYQEILKREGKSDEKN